MARTYLTNHEGPPQDDGHAVVLFPGLGADPGYMSALAKHCERLGHVCYDWGRGRNTGPVGPVAAWLRQLSSDIAKTVSHHSEEVALIGWSRGGLYAREVAKALPGRVRQVITLGSPFANFLDSTNVAWLYEVVNGDSPPVSHKRQVRATVPGLSGR